MVNSLWIGVRVDPIFKKLRSVHFPNLKQINCIRQLNKRSFHLNAKLNKKMMGTNYYDVLGVTPKASTAQIKSAYYKLSKIHHPDVNSSEDSKRKFVEISDAYEFLRNPKQRRMYNRQNFYEGHSGQSTTASDIDPAYQDFLKYRGTFKERGKSTTSKIVYNEEHEESNSHTIDQFYRENYKNYTERKRESTAEWNEFQENQRKYTTIGRIGVLFALFMNLALIWNALKNR